MIARYQYRPLAEVGDVNQNSRAGSMYRGMGWIRSGCVAQILMAALAIASISPRAYGKAITPADFTPTGLNPSITKLTRSYVRGQTGREVFGSRGGSTTFTIRDCASYVHFTVDPSWDRIVFAVNDRYIGTYGATGTGASQFNRPNDIDVTFDGELAVADAGNDRVVFLAQLRFVPPNCIFGASDPPPLALLWNGYIGRPDPGFAFSKPMGVSFDDAGTPTVTSDDVIWVADSGNNRVFQARSDFAGHDDSLGAYGALGSGIGQFKFPLKVIRGRAAMNGDPTATHNNDYLYVLDSGNGRIVKLSCPQGQSVSNAIWERTAVSPDPVPRLESLACDAWGNIYATDSAAQHVLKYSPDLELLEIYGTSGVGVKTGQLWGPRDFRPQFQQFWWTSPKRLVGTNFAVLSEFWDEESGGQGYTLGVEVRNLLPRVSTSPVGEWLRYAITDHAFLKIEVLDGAGVLVRLLDPAATFHHSGTDSIFWNGLRDNGTPAQLCQNYSFRVLPRSGYSASFDSLETKTVPFYFGQGIPVSGTPTSFSATDLGCDAVALSWAWSGSGQDGFRVRRNGVMVREIQDPNARAWADSTGTAGLSYSYSVRGYNWCGDGSASTADSGARWLVAPMTSASNVLASDGGYCCSLVRVTWSWSGNGAQGFKVFRDSSLVHTGTSSSERSWDDTLVPSGTSSNPHDYYVLAYNGCGDGSPSNHDSGFRCTPLTWMTDGTPMCTEATAFQYSPQSVTDRAGGAILVWEDRRNGKYDIYAQHVNAGGNPCWTPNGIPICTAAGDKSGIRVISDGYGGAFIAWSDPRNGVPGRWDVYVQHIDSNGQVKLGTDGRLLCGPNPSNVDRHSPDLVPYIGAGAVITWVDNRNGDGGDIYALGIDSQGTPFWSATATGVPVCTANGYQDEPRIALTVAANGYPTDCVIVWRDQRQFPLQYELYAQRLDVRAGTSTAVWPTNGVRLTTPPKLDTPVHRLVTDGNAGAIVSWEGYDPYPSSHLYAQHLLNTGALAWGTDGIRLSTAPGNQQGHDIISDGAGSAILVWGDSRNDEGDIYAQHLGSSGNALWTPNGLPVCAAPYFQGSPGLATDGAGGAIVAWGDARGGAPENGDIYARTVTAAGSLIGPSNSLRVTGAPGTQASLSIVPAFNPGSAVISWADKRNPTDDIYANLAFPQGGTPPDVAQSYFVPQAGLLASPCEGGTGTCGAVPANGNLPSYSIHPVGGAIGCARTCPDNDGGQVLRNWARLKIVVKASDGTPIANIQAADICAMLNGGTPGQGFSGPGADSIAADPQWSGGVAGGCPAVRCIQADAPTDATGTTYLTWIGHQASDPPGMGFRDPTRKWGGYDSDIPILVLGLKLQGKLTSGSPLGSYTAHVKNYDSAGNTLAAPNSAERVTSPYDTNPVNQAIGGTYNYKVDFDNSGAVTVTDLSALNGHLNHTCIFPLNP